MRERDRLDIILDALGAVAREMTRMAETQADILSKLSKLETAISNLEAAQDMTAIGNRLDAATARLDALQQAVTAPAPPASEPAPQIDPNTGQPVQPV